MCYNIYSQGKIIDVAIYTKDRGPRTDHGGGEDGDGWMSPGQIQRIATPYHKKWDPIIKSAIKKLKENGFKHVEGHMEYGEKGHIMLQFIIKLEK